MVPILYPAYRIDQKANDEGITYFVKEGIYSKLVSIESTPTDISKGISKKQNSDSDAVKIKTQ